MASSRRSNVSSVVLRIFTFVPIYALVAAVLLRGVEFPAGFSKVLDRIGDMMVPLALISVGFQLRVSRREFWLYAPKLGLGLLFKLVLAPLALCAFYLWGLKARGEVIQITLVESAMAPMVTGGIMAAEYGFSPSLAALMVGVGIPVSLLTVPIWAHLLRWV
jgi:predicted permease